MKNDPDFTIIGKVISKADGQGIPNLQIEAWDKDLIFNDLLGNAKTDETGSFKIHFTASHFAEFFFDRLPDVFFRIFEGNRLLQDTSHELLCILRPGIQHVSISLDYKNVGDQASGPVFTSFSGPLIDSEVLFRFKRSLSKILASFDSKYPPDALLALRFPFEGIPNLLDMASEALSGDPVHRQRFRETILSFGGEVVPSKLALRVFQQYHGNAYVGTEGKIKPKTILGKHKKPKLETSYFAKEPNTPQLIDLWRLEPLMAATAYVARDIKELASLAGSLELALAGMDELNTLFGLIQFQAKPIDIASAFDTAVRVLSFSFRPPFEGFTPGDDIWPIPGFGPGLGVPWFEWPLPFPRDPIPAEPSVPNPGLPEFEPGLSEHFEECFIHSIIPELHRIGIGFTGLIYGVGTNYIIERVSPDHACPGDTITLEGERFDGVVSVQYNDNRGRTISTSPTTASSTRITFTLAENAISGPVWLYIPKTVRLCLSEHVVALPGVSGELLVGEPHIISFEIESGPCLPIGETARLRWRVSPSNAEVRIIHYHGTTASTLASGLGAIGNLSYLPSSRGNHSFVLEATNPSADEACRSASRTINLDVRDVAPPPFEIVGVEITQAIQYYDLTNPSAPTNNSLDLIAGMDTILRVYVRALSPTTSRISGSLELNGNTYAPINTDFSGPSPIITASMDPQRSNTNDSLNFLIPAADASGSGIRAQIRAFSATNPCINPIEYREEILDWVNLPPLPVTVRIVANSNGTQMSLPVSTAFINNTFFKIPSPKTAISFHPGVHQIREGTTEDNYCDDGGFYQLALSIAYEHNDNEGYPPAPHSSSWIGLVTPTDCTPDGIMAWPSSSTCLSIQDITTAAHEIMHTVGLGHTITGGGEGCWEGPALTGGADTQPVACHRLAGRPTGRLIELPFDIRNNRVVTIASDLMSYRGGTNRWLSPELWVEGRTMINTRY